MHTQGALARRTYDQCSRGTMDRNALTLWRGSRPASRNSVVYKTAAHSGSADNRRLSPETCLTAHLKSFGRREASESLGCRNPRARGDGLWGFELWGMLGAGLRAGKADGVESRRSPIGAMLERHQMRTVRFSGRLTSADGNLRARGRPRMQRCCRAWQYHAAPGHGVILPAETIALGGGRGRRHPSKVSIMIM